MIRENQKFLNNIQIIVDMVIIVVSFLFAYYIRFYILDGHISMSFKEFFIPILISIPMYLLLYTIFDLYTAKRTKSIYKEIFDIVKVNFAGALILILGLYVFKIVNFSRVTLAIFIILNTTITSINRICLRYTLRKYRKKGLNQKHCLIIGATNTSKELINRINKNKHWGYNVVGIIDNHKNNDEYFEGFKVIGNFEDIEYVLDHKHIDIVFIAISAEEYIHIGSLLKACERGGVKTNIIPYYHKYVPAKPRMDDLDGLTMVDTRYVPLDSYIMAFS
ncbi:Gfo/Idh/MocA family oxidoreductase, partial [Romboutsia ilealis]|uniref:Gfo/Idh/MocA family oxidoreductase n=1 Tax=Romboutsia ilealis TaxID=1115758 RepID=UPI002573321D